MEESRIRELVAALDATRLADRERAWSELRTLGPAVAPYLAEFYTHARKWQGRASLVFYSTFFARQSEPAFQLGVAALSDRAYEVRLNACGLLAYSQRKDALRPLKALLDHDDPRTVADARAAIDAIRSRNHHYFVDRNHTGRVRWMVGDPSAPGAAV